jgi:hypothetical protein
VTRHQSLYRATAPVALVVLVLAGFAFGGSHAHSLRRARAEEASRRSVAPQFLLSGSVRGMFPGRIASIPVRVRNPLSFPIIVKVITARVGSPRSGCSARNVRIEPIHGEWRIDPGATARLQTKVRMSMAAPDTCQGLGFPLRFRGKAVRA